DEVSRHVEFENRRCAAFLVLRRDCLWTMEYPDVILSVDCDAAHKSKDPLLRYFGPSRIDLKGGYLAANPRLSICPLLNTQTDNNHQRNRHSHGDRRVPPHWEPPCLTLRAHSSGNGRKLVLPPRRAQVKTFRAIQREPTAPTSSNAICCGGYKTVQWRGQ